MKHIQEMVQACIQCGTCSGSCPNAFAMDLTPRHLWRLVLLGEQDEIFKSATFGLCSACYTCTLRCPRELPLTDAMSALKQEAVKAGYQVYREGACFYESFMDSIRRYGRVREAEFMTRYFVLAKDPMLPMRFATLGMKLMAKGKVSLQVPSFQRAGTLEPIFHKVEMMEGRTQ